MDGGTEENIYKPSTVTQGEFAGWQAWNGFDPFEDLTGQFVFRVEENGKVFIMTNPFAPNDHMAINESDIAKKGTRKISMMPPGLINSLNQNELLDLIAYLTSGGNVKDKVFQK